MNDATKEALEEFLEARDCLMRLRMALKATIMGVCVCVKMGANNCGFPSSVFL